MTVGLSINQFLSRWSRDWRLEYLCAVWADYDPGTICCNREERGPGSETQRQPKHPRTPLTHKILITYALADPNSHQVNHPSGDSKHVSSSSHHLQASDHAGVGLTGRLWVLRAAEGEVLLNGPKKVTEIQAKSLVRKACQSAVKRHSCEKSEWKLLFELRL